MQPEAIHEMAAAEDRHWWFMGTRDVVIDVLRRAIDRSPRQTSVLDAGCGSGYTLTRLRALGFQTRGCDVSAVALERAGQRGLTELTRAELTDLPYDDGAFDAFVCLDVLEHVERDVEACEELCRILRPRGVGIVAVPAWPLLYGPHDLALGHLRRYRKHELRAVLERGGFRVERLTYYNSLLSPLVAAVRLWDRWRGGEAETDVVVPPTPINVVLRRALASEGWLLRRASLPVGISLLAVVRPR